MLTHSQSSKSSSSSSGGYVKLSKSPTPEFKDNRQIAKQQRKFKKVANESSSQSLIPLEEDIADYPPRFENALKRLVHKHNEEDEDSDYTSQCCAAGSRFVFETLTNGTRHAEADATIGIDSLREKMNSLSGLDKEFLYYVNADGLVGHRFTILQHGDQAMLLQGYSGQYSVSDSIADPSKSIEGILNSLASLINIKKKWMSTNTITEEDGTVFSDTHQELFRLSLNAEGIKKEFLKGRIHRTQNDIEWEVRSTDGQAVPVGKKGNKPKKDSCCIMM
ncbi:hypothetical protein GCM10028818_00190 [Spirosoma horti]